MVRPVAAASVALLALAGCASPTLDAQWTDPQAAGNSMRGARVLVACEAGDTALRRICQDRLAAEVVARGATPVMGPDVATADGRDDAYLPAARAAGARGVLVATVASAEYGGGGSGASIGLGGFGFGSGRVGGGVGISVPIGGIGNLGGSMRYSATGRITDTASGRLLWTAKATAPSSGDFGAQMGELARTVLDAADKAGLF